jgi:hypothetical protein
LESHYFALPVDGQKTEAIVRRDLFFAAFLPMMRRYFALGYNQAQFAAESNTHVSIVSRALNEETIPRRYHLRRWCAVLYKHGIITNETIAEGNNLFHLLGYASPSDEHKAISQITEQQAIVKQVKTDELPPSSSLSLPAWARRS